jgi:hypothetical protein
VVSSAGRGLCGNVPANASSAHDKSVVSLALKTHQQRQCRLRSRSGIDKIGYCENKQGTIACGEFTAGELRVVCNGEPGMVVNL